MRHCPVEWSAFAHGATVGGASDAPLAGAIVAGSLPDASVGVSDDPGRGQ